MTTDLPTNALPPFIADQGLRLLMADGDPSRFLMPEAFRTQRQGPEGPSGQGGGGQEQWQSVDRDAVALDRLVGKGQQSISLRRLVVTTDAGVGKTTTLGWMLHRNHEPDSRAVAFGLALGGPVSTGGDSSCLISLGGSIPANGDQLIAQVLAPRVCRAVTKQITDLEDRARKLLVRLRDQGRLVLLFDALDQASGDGAAVRLLVGLLTDRRWNDCRIVVSGRPHALQRYWGELFANPRIGWRYLQADEFTEKQRRAFLGKVDDAKAGQAPGIHAPEPVPVSQDRYDRVPEEAREILAVPRALEYLRRLPDDQWSTIRTASDVYWQSIRQLVLSGLNNSAEARRLGLLPGEATPDKAHGRQFTRAMEMLGAIAFQMTATTIPRGMEQGTDSDRRHLLRGVSRNAPLPTEVPNFDRIEPQGMDKFRENVMSRVARKRFDDMSEQDKRLFEHDFDCLAAMNDVLSQGLLDVARESVGGLNQVLWRNRTLQEFFTACWLANHGTHKLGDRLWNWIYRPAKPLSAEYYWVWRFLTEMPDGAIGKPKTWVQAVEPLYRPGNGRADQTKRSNEMIYRSWRRLDALAEQNELAAVRVRDTFLGEFERIRTGKWDHNAEEGKRRAEEFIRSLLEIPAGRFRMGAPAEKQSWHGNETPEETYREPYVDAFRLSHSPTINAWYRLYDPGHGAQHEDYDDGYGRFSESDETPVICVKWYDAWAFCLWAHWDGQSCRLPQEHEWEYAAKAGMPWDWNYWWGDELDATKCNTASPANAATVPTEDHANPFRMRDILGNVWEWSVNEYQERYAATPPEKGSARVLRGGSWDCYARGLRSAYRNLFCPTFTHNLVVGFRVARAL